MPEPTPLHGRTAALCTSLRWKEWAGYHAVCRFDTSHENEYLAMRHAAGLLDVTPLYKYDVSGPDAAAYLSRVMARDIGRLRPGRVSYCCWCDEAGKVIDDGTVAHRTRGEYRITSAHASQRWLERNAAGFDVRIVETSESVAALALQGPTSREVLAALPGAEPACALRFFGVCDCEIDDVAVSISRTGFTGDLGYELWVDADRACWLWDRLMAAGAVHGLVPVGLDALDMTRIEAGFPLIEVDFHSARHAMTPSQAYSPFEIGLGWTVQLGRADFVGREALLAERAAGSPRAFVGLEMSWDDMAAAFARHGLPPSPPAEAWRTAVPVYGAWGGRIGMATSGTWSPLLKRNVALATVPTRHAEPGTRLGIEWTVEAVRYRIGATVVPRPFFDPPRKRS